MFIITNGSGVQALAADVKSVKEYLIVRKNAYAKQYIASGRSSYMTQNYPTENSFIAAHLRGLRIVEADVTGLIDLDYNGVRRLLTVYPDVTSSFFTLGNSETQVGEHITADVVKKGLKSFGKNVTIETRLTKGAYTVAPSPAEFKQMYDQMARIVCVVDQWGKITVAPDALDNYKMTPKMKVTPTITFVE